jgi:hypothetical protein
MFGHDMDSDKVATGTLEVPARRPRNEDPLAVFGHYCYVRHCNHYDPCHCECPGCGTPPGIVGLAAA